MKTLLLSLVAALVMSTGTAIAIPTVLVLKEKTETVAEHEQQTIDYINSMIEQGEYYNGN